MHSHAKAFVASAVILAACWLPGFAQGCAAQAAVSAAGQVIVPPELSAAAEFVNMLQRAGVVVQDVRSVTKLFPDAEQAAFILTNLGAVEVEVFKSEMDAESITVTYGLNGDSRVMHAYDFSRPKGNKVGWATSSTPLYFTLHNRWFIKTGSAQLDTLIKHALGQAHSINR
jgi:hypothetical protein